MANTQGEGVNQPETEATRGTKGGAQGSHSPELDLPESAPPELIMLREWIRENQTSALVGAFAVGSLIGYWMKN